MADEKLEEERQRFLKSILSRGPHKRQIKPAENSPLLQFALGEDDDDDSEEDEDFEVHEDYDSGSDDEEEDNSRAGAASFVPGDQSEDSDSDSDSEMEVDAHGGPSAALTVGALIEAMKKNPLPKGHASSVASSEGPEGSKKMDILICGVCLDDVSDEGDEIVECDNCGMTVHEGCYGINDEDNDSGKSNETDSPTEAWFCDSCRAREKAPDCELCPNLGGIFKETDSGQWVHLLCALYTPGVAFVKPETLESVTLSELTPYRWGAKDCSLCEDERFSRTGVCVSCDAGMCKTYFHITCAQMHGLLSDVPEECEEDVADPLYAHCKLHADKKSTASRRRAWMAYQSRYKKREERVSTDDKTRLKTLLQEARRLFREQKKKDHVEPYTPTEKVPHLLSSCPGACRQLFKKAELLGYATKQNHGVVNVRRKWFVAPALTCEFVNYYHDRDHRLKEMGERQEELQSNSKLLHEEEQKLRLKFDKLSDDVQGFSVSVNLSREENKLLHCILCDLGAQEFNMPEILEVKETKPIASDSPAEVIEIHECFTCKKTDNQHQMVDCDTCRNFYHLACVDPPLTRMPKKSAKCLWQCSECDSSEDEDEMDVDVSDNTPISQSRQRRVIKEPTKFTPDKLELSKKIRRKRKSGDGSSELESAKKKTKVEPKQTSKRTRKYVRIEKVIDKRSECSHCGKAGENSTLVRCDSCKLCYHFGCLDPPVKSNPKKRGYMWYCTDCDESEEDSEEEVGGEQAANISLEGTGGKTEQAVEEKEVDGGRETVNEGKTKEEKGEKTVSEEQKKTLKEKGDDTGKEKVQGNKKNEKGEESVSEEKKKTLKEKGDDTGKEKVQGNKKKEKGEESVSEEKKKTLKEKGDDTGKEKVQGNKKKEKGEESVSEEKKKTLKEEGDDTGKDNAEQEKTEEEETAEESVKRKNKALQEECDVANANGGKDGRKGDADTHDGKAERGKKKKLLEEQSKRKVNEEEMGEQKGSKVDGKKKDEEESTEGVVEGGKKEGKDNEREGKKKDEEQKNKKEKTKEQGKKKRKSDEQKTSSNIETQTKGAGKLKDKDNKTETEGSTKDTEKKTDKEKQEGKKKGKSDKTKGKSPKEKCEAEDKPKEKRDNAKRSR